MDGGRVVRGESFTVRTQPGRDLLWIMRVHPLEAASLAMYAGGERVGVRVIPQQPGQWLEVASLIPAALVTNERTTLSTTAFSKVHAGHAGAVAPAPAAPGQGVYLPSFHWVYQGDLRADDTLRYPAPPATFAGGVTLVGRALAYEPATRVLTVRLEWRADEQASAGDGVDAKLFIHLYDAQGRLVEAPNAQFDGRPGGGALPPANWLPGIWREEYTLRLDAVPTGRYRVALGLYAPTGDMARFPVTGEGADADRRLFIGAVEVGP
jgi:hypothetical protein